MCVCKENEGAGACVCRWERDRATSRQACSPAGPRCGGSLVGCLGESVHPSWPPRGQACATFTFAHSLPSWVPHPSQKTSPGLLRCLALSGHPLKSSSPTILAPKAPCPLLSPPAAWFSAASALPQPEMQPFSASHQRLHSHFTSPLAAPLSAHLPLMS